MNKTPSNQLIPSILTNEDVFCMELSESEILHNKIEHIKEKKHKSPRSNHYVECKVCGEHFSKQDGMKRCKKCQNEKDAKSSKLGKKKKSKQD